MLASALSVFLYATAALAFVARVSEPANPGGPGRCSTTISVEKIIEAEQEFAASKGSRSLAERASGSVTIQVYFHVISADNTLAGGSISDATISLQMQVLNDNFGGSGLVFNLANTDRTVNADWFNNAAPDTAQQTAMKKALRQGGRGDLNVYSVGFASTDHLGYATFPSDVAVQPQDDGVVIRYSSVPGGSSSPYNEGKTLTHEVGHWVGLYHTFEGSCSPPGDYVVDTPAEASPAFGCNTGRDTCPEPGLDPINNYMDYSDDSCMNQFTLGQSARLRAQIAYYRGIA